MSDYAAAAGFIQFDPKDREVNGQEVKDIVIRAVGSQRRVYITVWPDHESSFDLLEKGAFVAADGKFAIRTKEDEDGESVDYANLSAGHLVVIAAAPKKEREVVNKKKSSSSSKAKGKSGGNDEIPF